MSLTVSDFKTSRKLIILKFKLVEQVVHKETQKINITLDECNSIVKEACLKYEEGDKEFSNDFYKYLTYYKDEINAVYKDLSNFGKTGLTDNAVDSIYNLGVSLLEFIWKFSSKLEKVLFMENLIVLLVNTFHNPSKYILKDKNTKDTILGCFEVLKEELDNEFDELMIMSLDTLDEFYSKYDALNTEVEEDDFEEKEDEEEDEDDFEDEDLEEDEDKNLDEDEEDEDEEEEEEDEGKEEEDD